MTEIKLTTCKKILAEKSNLRVSPGAAEMVAEELTDLLGDIAHRSRELAVHCGRKTIKADDVKLVLKEYFE